MDPEHMKWIAHEVQNGRFLFYPNGSYLSQYDDPKNYFPGVIKFLKDLDNGEFRKG
jgi:proline iminopeptidase